MRHTQVDPFCSNIGTVQWQMMDKQDEMEGYNRIISEMARNFLRAQGCVVRRNLRAWRAKKAVINRKQAIALLGLFPACPSSTNTSVIPSSPSPTGWFSKSKTKGNETQCQCAAKRYLGPDATWSKSTCVVCYSLSYSPCPMCRNTNLQLS